VIDMGEAVVPDVFQASLTQREHEPVGRLDRYLGVVDAVNQ
jgi:hypothetical protein